jgi:hypothetical protein
MSEKASERLERLALEFVEKVRGGKRRSLCDNTGVAIHISIGFKTLCRESVRHSLLIEFGDMGEEGFVLYSSGYSLDVVRKYGPVIDRWIEEHIELIGEVSFSGGDLG